MGQSTPLVPRSWGMTSNAEGPVPSTHPMQTRVEAGSKPACRTTKGWGDTPLLRPTAPLHAPRATAQGRTATCPGYPRIHSRPLYERPPVGALCLLFPRGSRTREDGERQSRARSAATQWGVFRTRPGDGSVRGGFSVMILLAPRCGVRHRREPVNRWLRPDGDWRGLHCY
jgi:hypothetical protein